MRELRLRAASFLVATAVVVTCSSPLRADSPVPAVATADPAWQQALTAARAALLERHGAAESARIERGLRQTLRSWRPEDGDAASWRQFVVDEFLPAGAPLDATYARLQFALERLDGYLLSLSRDWRWGVDVAAGPQLAIDTRLAAWDPTAHVAEDLYANKLAFVVLLNFPVVTLPERLAGGAEWSRRIWAETRLADRFATRLPGAVQQQIATALTAAETYVNGYYLRVDRLMAGGKQLFPEGKRLIAHWNLRDELKAAYGAGDRSENLARQRALQALMEAIVRQSIPQAVIDNPELRWDLGTSVVTRADGTPCPTAARCTEREPDTRYARWLEVFRAMRAADPYDADNPTFIARRFNRDRELPQQEVERLLTQVLDSPLAAQVAETIRTRLGRRLEPFDLWYAGFKPAAAHAEADLDRLTRARYPNAAAFQADIPRILRALGFSAQQTDYLAARITVDPSRGAGHALQMARRDDLAHLRTHIKPEGMDYKGYNIAIHELGHNVEQVFSVTAIDETLLSGVPNNAFTEALAFLFQARDLELLGLPPAGAEAQRDRVLEEFWATREISAVALVDLRAWQWLYAHPDARPAQFREAVVQIAAEHWDRWFAPYLGGKGSSLLAIYSHLLQYGLYLPDYALGHLIALQIEQHFAAHPGEFGAEWERVTRLGRLTPDLWMRQAVGAPLSADPLLRATTQALSARAAGSAPARSAP